MLKQMLFWVTLGFLLAACSTIQSTQEATSTTTTVGTTLEVSATKVPPTETIIPTLTPTEEPTPEPTEVIELVYPSQGYGPENFPDYINPLTGLLVAEPDILNRRPLAVKISIIPRELSRPPWGLSQADIVYDYYHNSGYTRLHAIYYGNEVEVIGPIRSARFPDDQLIRMYKSIFAYGSADYRINNRLLNASYTDRLVLEGPGITCPPTEDNPLCRVDPDGADHLLTSTKELTQYINKKGVDNTRQNLDGLFFQLSPPTDGENATSIFTRYSGDSYSRWDYDHESGKYLRFQDNVYDEGQGEEYAPLMDRHTDEQITAANVVLILASHDYFLKTETTEIIEIPLTGFGIAYVFRDGLTYKVNWGRTSEDIAIFFVYDDGSRFPLKPGNSWFQIVGQTTPVSQENDTWRFEFQIP